MAQVYAGGTPNYNEAAGGGYFNPQQPPQTMPQYYNVAGLTTTKPGYTPLTGLLGSEQAMAQGLSGGLNALQGGYGGYGGSAGYALGGGGYGGGVDLSKPRINRKGEYKDIQKGLGQFVNSGQQALGLQGALSGAQGQQAFNQAYTDSPVQAFLREQGDRAVTRNAAAMGGLGGGNVMKELTRFGQGLAGTQLQQQIDNLGALSNQGLSANIGQGSLLGNVEGIEAGRYATNVGSQTSQANARTAANASMANMRNQIGFNRDQAIANAIMGTGNNMAQGRMNVGAGMSQNINNTTSNLANLINQQGHGLSNLTGQGSANIAQILSALGGNNASSQEQLATTLGNWGQGNASQVAGLPAVGQFQGNQLQDWGNILSGAGNFYNAYQQNQRPNDVYQGNYNQSFTGYDNPGSSGYVAF